MNLERFGVITFSDREHERVPNEPVEYYYEHTYFLEIEFTEEFLYDKNQEFDGIRPLLNITARHGKSYKRDGKLLSENMIDEYIEFTMDDPGGHRLYAVSKRLEFYVQDQPWLNKIFQMM